MHLKSAFPVLNNCTYLNTPGSGLLSKAAAEWRQAHDADFLNRGSGFRENQAGFLKLVREELAGFFNAKAGNVFLVPNFSFGFNTFLDGLPGKHRFLLLEEDYPSVNYPISSRGFDCSYVKIDENLEEALTDKIRTFKPDVFAFSVVQYLSGLKIDLRFIKDLKRQFPDLLIVADGTQFCGTETFDFNSSGIDMLASSGYKWMLSGYGNGFVMLSDETAGRLFAQAGKVPAPSEPFLKDRSPLSMAFEPGHLDTLNFGTLYQSLLFFKASGTDVIAEKVAALGRAAKAAFAEVDLLDPFLLDRREHSSIFNLAVPDKVQLELNKQSVICMQRGKGTRVGFHFYNDEEDLGILLEIIKRYR